MLYSSGKHFWTALTFYSIPITVNKYLPENLFFLWYKRFECILDKNNDFSELIIYQDKISTLHLASFELDGTVHTHHVGKWYNNKFDLETEDLFIHNISYNTINT